MHGGAETIGLLSFWQESMLKHSMKNNNMIIENFGVMDKINAN